MLEASREPLETMIKEADMANRKISAKTLAQLSRMTARMARRRGRSFMHMNRTRLVPDLEPVVSTSDAQSRRTGRDHRSAELALRVRLEELIA
jgi:hypothetical protein